MSTTLRGSGAFKRDLMRALIRKFGRHKFTYKEAAAIPEFDHRAFMSLYSDRLIKRISRETPLQYSLMNEPRVACEDISSQLGNTGSRSNLPVEDVHLRGETMF